MKTYYPELNNQRCKKLLEKFIKKLDIKSEGENYVLQWILAQEERRRFFVYDIREIKTDKIGLIQVRASTSTGSYSFSVSDINGGRWRSGVDRERYVFGDLHHKMG